MQNVGSPGSGKDRSEPLVGTASELRPRLYEVLSSVLPADCAEAALPHLIAELDPTEPPLDPARMRRVDVALNEVDTYYAIHDDDLKILKEATAVSAALIAMLKDPAGVIGGLVALLYRYRRKRIRLDGDQGVVLRALRRAPADGWPPEELARHLPYERELDAQAVSSLLERLKSVRKHDGEVTALVAERDGRWWAIDV